MKHTGHVRCLIAICALTAGASAASAQGLCDLPTTACSSALTACDVQNSSSVSVSKNDLDQRIANYLKSNSSNLVNSATNLGLGLNLGGDSTGGNFDYNQGNGSQITLNQITNFAQATAAHLFSAGSNSATVVTCDTALATFGRCMQQLIDRCAATGWSNKSSLNPTPKSPFVWDVRWTAPQGIDPTKLRPLFKGLSQTGGAHCTIPPTLIVNHVIPIDVRFSLQCRRTAPDPAVLTINVDGVDDDTIWIPQFKACEPGTHMDDSSACVCDDPASTWNAAKHRCLSCPTGQVLGNDGTCRCADASQTLNAQGKCVAPQSNKDGCTAEDPEACSRYALELEAAASADDAGAQHRIWCWRGRGRWIIDRNRVCNDPRLATSPPLQYSCASRNKLLNTEFASDRCASLP